MKRLKNGGAIVFHPLIFKFRVVFLSIEFLINHLGNAVVNEQACRASMVCLVRDDGRHHKGVDRYRWDQTSHQEYYY